MLLMILIRTTCPQIWRDKIIKLKFERHPTPYHPLYIELLNLYCPVPKKKNLLILISITVFNTSQFHVGETSEDRIGSDRSKYSASYILL